MIIFSKNLVGPFGNKKWGHLPPIGVMWSPYYRVILVEIKKLKKIAKLPFLGHPVNRVG
jgi:hypothetical protein